MGNQRNIVRDAINNIDGEVNNYGYDGGYGYDGYGLADERAMGRRPRSVYEGRPMSTGGPGLPPGGPGRLPMGPPAGAPSITANPAIQGKIDGTSTFKVTVSVVKNGTGSGNTNNPVFFFGGDAFSNTTKGYTAVKANVPVQTTGLVFANGKNCIKFQYGDDTNNATYTVTLSTDGEYPFVLNRLSGDAAMQVEGIQCEVRDSTLSAQLQNAIQAFELTEFGKATTNDLTTPKDLYQFATNGVFYPHHFVISGRKGMIAYVNEVNGLIVDYYFYVRKGQGCGCKH